MTDRFASRRAFLRRAFVGAGAIAIAGPAVLDTLDRLSPRSKTYVDFGRHTAKVQNFNAPFQMLHPVAGYAWFWAANDAGGMWLR